MGKALKSGPLAFSLLDIFRFDYFVSSICNGIIGPLFIIYLLSLEFNPWQIGLILAIERLAIIVFEFPTGIIADIFGRRVSIIISYIISTFVYLGWFFYRSFSFLIILAIAGGVAYAFRSGARDSLIINNLQLEANDKSRNRTFSSLSIFSYLGCTLGGLTAAALALINMRLIWLVAFLVNLTLLFIYLFFISETPKKKIIQLKEINFNSVWQKIINYFSIINKNIQLKYIIWIDIFLSLGISMYTLVFPVLLKTSFQLPDYYFGILGSISSFVGILGVWFFEKLADRKNYYISINIVVLLIFAFLNLFGLSTVLIIALALYVLIELIINGWYPILQSFFNKFIPDDFRAGILSLNSSLVLAAMAIGEIVAGWLLNLFLPGQVIIFSAFLLLPILFFNRAIKDLQKLK